MKNYGLILAAGKGTRMQTDLPKCAFPILRKPMIEYIVDEMEKSVIDEVVTIVGHKKEVIMDILKQRSSFAEQKNNLERPMLLKRLKKFLAEKKEQLL